MSDEDRQWLSKYETDEAILQTLYPYVHYMQLVGLEMDEECDLEIQEFRRGHSAFEHSQKAAPRTLTELHRFLPRTHRDQFKELLKSDKTIIHLHSRHEKIIFYRHLTPDLMTSLQRQGKLFGRVRQTAEAALKITSNSSSHHGGSPNGFLTPWYLERVNLDTGSTTSMIRIWPKTWRFDLHPRTSTLPKTFREYEVTLSKIHDIVKSRTHDGFNDIRRRIKLPPLHEGNQAEASNARRLAVYEGWED